MRRFTIANNIKFLKDIAHCLCNFKRNRIKTMVLQVYIVFIARNTKVEVIKGLIKAIRICITNRIQMDTNGYYYGHKCENVKALTTTYWGD